MDSLNELGAIFSHLDSLRDILSETLGGWQPPVLMAIGSEIDVA
jgi:hypothetical protein